MIDDIRETGPRDKIRNQLAEMSTVCPTCGAPQFEPKSWDAASGRNGGQNGVNRAMGGGGDI